MTAFLLDANVLIALVVEEHEHHEQVSRWVAALAPADRLATSPVVEGSLVRFLTRLGVRATTAGQVLAEVRALPTTVWWPDAVSYADVDLTAVRGHRQVTDAYLVGLATKQGGRLATLDQALVRTWPHSATAIPTAASA